MRVEMRWWWTAPVASRAGMAVRSGPMFRSERMRNWWVLAAVSASRQILSMTLPRSVAVEEQVMSMTQDLQPV